MIKYRREVRNMDNEFVRITQIELHKFKNVEHGVITFCNYKNAKKDGCVSNTDIMAIYGQNGSGKTAMVEAIRMLKDILSGEQVSNKYYYLLEPGCNTGMDIEFLVRKNHVVQRVNYSFKIEYQPPDFEDENEGVAYLAEESLGFRTLQENGKWDRIKFISMNQSEDSSMSLPKNRFTSKALVELGVIKRFAKKESKSFFFYNDVLELLNRNHYDYVDLSIVHEIIKFGRINLFVITMEQLGLINIGSFAPFYFRMESENSISSGGIPINLFGESRIPLQQYNLVTKMIAQINCVLDAIIPGLQITMKGEEDSTPDGRRYKKIKFFAHRYEKTFSLEYESEGIKRIISITSVLVAMVNNPSVCLVVDEFDSGVFEYLLGQLLQVIDTSAKGQFIFTSHNLHALEVLPKEKIIFSTADPKERYTTLKGLGNSNNLRDVYLRAVFLGTREENLYESTDITSIKRAFRKAGRLYGE